MQHDNPISFGNSPPPLTGLAQHSDGGGARRAEGATLTDHKLPHTTNNQSIDYYLTDITSAQDYYPGGMLMPGRSYSSDSYRFGFNGKENDNEVKGTGNQQDYGFRIYDPRAVRFLSVDPLTREYPWYTPYQFAGNSPIKFIDLDGCEPAEPGTEKGQMSTAKINDSENKDNYRWDWNGDNWENKGRMLDEVVISADKSLPNINSSGISTSKTNSTPTTLNMPNREFPSKITEKSATPWMNTALKEFNAGVKEDPIGSNSGPRVDVYLKYAGVPPPNKWCGAFVHWCLGQNGIKGAGAKGENYLKWGVKLKIPKYGAIAVFNNNHVGFYMGTYPDGSLKILHGNWSNKVTISKPLYDPVVPNQIKEYRFPKIY